MNYIILLLLSIICILLLCNNSESFSISSGQDVRMIGVDDGIKNLFSYKESYPTCILNSVPLYGSFMSMDDNIIDADLDKSEIEGHYSEE